MYRIVLTADRGGAGDALSIHEAEGIDVARIESQAWSLLREHASANPPPVGWRIEDEIESVIATSKT